MTGLIRDVGYLESRVRMVNAGCLEVRAIPYDGHLFVRQVQIQALAGGLFTADVQREIIEVLMSE